MKHQKGFIHFLPLVVLAVVIAGGYLVFAKFKKQEPSSPPTEVHKASKYRNEKLGFELTFPKDYPEYQTRVESKISAWDKNIKENAISFLADSKGIWVNDEFELISITAYPISWWTPNAVVEDTTEAYIKGDDRSLGSSLGIYLGQNNQYAFTRWWHHDCPEKYCGLPDVTKTIKFFDAPRPITSDIYGEKCEHNTIEEYGVVNTKSDILIYSTGCIIKLYSNNEADEVVRFYATNGTRTFNKMIYSVLNTREFSGLTYAEVVGRNRNAIKIYRARQNNETALIDVSGKGVSLPQEEAETGILLSPDGEHLAFTGRVDLEEAARRITVKNINTGQIKSYNFTEVGLNGVYVADWSPDSKTLYVAGGLYEFSAPAKLWKITVNDGEPTSFAGLDDFVYPVHVFGKDGVAFVRKGVEPFSEEITDIDLYRMNLGTGNIERVATEKAVSAFSLLKKFSSDLFYDVWLGTADDGQAQSKIKQINLTSKIGKVLYEGNVGIVGGSTRENWLLIIDNGQYKIYDVLSKKEKILGRSSQTGGRDMLNTEYISDIAGVIISK